MSTETEATGADRRGLGGSQSGCGGLVEISFPPHPSVQTAQ